jgi:hypothetical protein
MSSGRYMTCDLHDCRKAEYAPDFDPQPSESAERWVTVARHQPDNPVPVSNYCSVLHLLMGEAAAIGSFRVSLEERKRRDRAARRAALGSR